MEYLVVNENDGNDSFTVEASDSDNAAYKALEELGYYIADEED